MTDDNIKWEEYLYNSGEEGPAVSLDITDYVALFVAALQTIFLPLVVLGVFLFALSIFFTLMW